MKLVFIVEDEDLFIVKLRSIFIISDMDVELKFAKDSKEAIDKFLDMKASNTLPDIILLDINLKRSNSEMNGLEVGKHYRELDKDVLIFMISTSKDEIGKAKNNGMNGYIYKKGIELSDKLIALKDDYAKFKTKELTWKEYVD